jgi:GAF domain-containing protein
MATSAEDRTVVERAEGAIAAATDHLGLLPSELPQAALRCQLDGLRQRLEQRLAQSPELTHESAASAELFISITGLQCELLDHDVSRRVRCLTEIRKALRDLRGLSPRKMIYAAPMVLSREFGFARSMISAVRGSVWLPQHLHIEDEADSHSRRFREFVAGAHIQLADAPWETELVRKRCGVLVASPREDKRMSTAIVDVFGCFGYIAAPITVQGRVIGMLHADRPEPDGVVTMDHLDRLEAFAECLAVAFESAVLEEKTVQQLAAVSNLYPHVDELVRRSAGSALWSRSGGTPGTATRWSLPQRSTRWAVVVGPRTGNHVISGDWGHQQSDRAVPGDLRRDGEDPSQTHCQEAQYVQQGRSGRRLCQHRFGALR